MTRGSLYHSVRCRILPPSDLAAPPGGVRSATDAGSQAETQAHGKGVGLTGLNVKNGLGFEDEEKGEAEREVRGGGKDTLIQADGGKGRDIGVRLACVDWPAN